MAKDPAILFYPSDWIMGTMGMTFEQKGAYMELLMMQFSQGHMSDHMIQHMVGHMWQHIMHKFKQDDQGLWYNARLDEEKNRRQNFVNSRKSNLLTSKKGKKDTSHMIPHMDNHMNHHMENVNINEDKKEEVKGGKGEKEEESDWSHVPAADFSFNPDLVREKHDLYCSQQIWLEQACMVLRIDLNTIERLLFDFLLQKNTQLELNGKSDREIKSYFINWAKSQQDKAKKYQSHGKLTREERDDALKNWSL